MVRSASWDRKWFLNGSHIFVSFTRVFLSFGTKFQYSRKSRQDEEEKQSDKAARIRDLCSLSVPQCAASNKGNSNSWCLYCFAANYHYSFKIWGKHYSLISISLRIMTCFREWVFYFVLRGVWEQGRNMGYIQSCAFVFHHFIPLQVDRKLLLRVSSLTGNAPDLVGVVPFKNLKKSGHSDFQAEKRNSESPNWLVILPRIRNACVRKGRTNWLKKIKKTPVASWSLFSQCRALPHAVWFC